MPEIITVKEIIWPAQGKRQGKVIDTTGKSWQVWADKLSGFQQDGSYELLEVGASEFQGKTYYTIKSVKPVTHGMRLTPPPTPTSRPQEHTMDHERRRDIFVCGAVNSILGHPTIDPLTFAGAQLVDIINKLKYVWEQTLGPNAPKAPLRRGEADATFNDDIPF